MKGSDQISKLPEPILQHILSFLVVKDAARTSILSKAWNNAWTSLSYLNFGDKIFRESKDIVDQILATRQKQNISIQKFMVKLPNNRSKDVDDWTKLLVTCNIKELFIKACKYPYNKLPEAIFAAKTLKVLHLGGFKLELPSTGIKFSSLRELQLEDSHLNDQFLQVLCASCSNLDFLSFGGFGGLTCLQVAGTLPKLRRLHLLDCPWGFERVDIAVPILIDLYISSLSGELNVINITACETLQHLNLSDVAVTDQWLQNLLPHLPNLEVFHASYCPLLKTVKISSQRLKYLQVVVCDNLIEVDLDTPNLLGFESDVRYGMKGFSFICDYLPTFKLKTSHLMEANLKLISEPFGDWCTKLIRSLGKFNHSRAITLSCKTDKWIVIPKEMRKDLIPPLYGTKLRVNINNGLNYSVADVLENLLWISPQLDTLSFGRVLNGKTLKFTYRYAADGEDERRSCCASLLGKCWRHTLKKVELQNFTCRELEKLRNYFFTNTNICEIIEVPKMQLHSSSLYVL